MDKTNNASPRITFLLKFVFFFSGFASLIYQVVWQRLLTTHYGVGSISITLIVSVYMFGLGVGALIGGYLAERAKDKIKLYFLVELLLGIFGLISLPFLGALGRSTAGSSYIVSFCFMFIFLCIPTVLMGITLPLLTKIYNRLVQDFLASVSILYFINTLGAALGAVFASYVIISFFGLDTGIYVAAAINFILAILIFTVRSYPEVLKKPSSNNEEPAPHDTGLGRVAYLLVFITGFFAIGYEIAWFRVVGILVKESAYAFSSVLSVYLTGIAVGSFVIKKYIKNKKAVHRKNTFFLIQFLIGAYGIAIFAGYYYATRYTPLSLFTELSFSQILHPSFDIIFSLTDMNSFVSGKRFLMEIYSLTDVFFWPIFFVLVPTILMGASFPLLSSLAIARHDREGSTVGNVYFFNISGNVLGGIITGFVFLPMLGTETTLLTFGTTALLFGLFVSGNKKNKLFFKTCLASCIGVLIALSVLFFPSKGQLYKAMHNAFDSTISFNEGVGGVILAQRNSDPTSLFQTKLYINGSMHGALPGYHCYASAGELFNYVPEPKNVLVIGYGIGTFPGAVLLQSETVKVTLVELSRTLMETLKDIPFCNKMFADKRFKVVIDDGRRYLLKTPEKFDLIIMDPLKPIWAYSNNLYSVEFFKLAQKHLTEDGVLFVGIDGKEVMAKTLISVFDHVRRYNFGFFASNTPFIQNDFDAQNYLSSFPVSAREIITSIQKGNTFLGEKPLLIQNTVGYPLNRDLKPRSEYYLGLQVKEKLFTPHMESQQIPET